MGNSIYIPSKPLNTAVLFLVFNRLETTKKVFKAIRKAQPPRIYVAADGPRENKAGELQKVRETRDYIIQNIDWECRVFTLFRENNLGCKVAVSSAIEWFFDHENQGIILEDDCLPSLSFFWFCEELLEKYKDDYRIGHISGNNFQNGIKRGGYDYYYSIYNHIWGWASWSSRWKNYDVNLENFDNSDFIEAMFQDKKTIKYWKDIYIKMKDKLIDTWDYQWTFSIWKQKQLSIIPNINLVKNIGFGVDATHTTQETEFSNIENHEIYLKDHPDYIEQNKFADDLTSKIMFNKKSFYKRLLNKIRVYIK
tara:strand:- start:20 stop:946 length:927 start_codon:yes stop_codon:yes gene_type:complete